ncbi:nitrate- and nitrite sensing domain-containing protein [Nonomuraea sp. NBC_01738]|uniref:sensor histidine kinase n=1 Tax=Nonomuraea sp. NBC_01738 TaxID=2976003 RepID=UPI002E1097E4|nr:nitrate- and nitrite sensing domain-containing protein [Nonomuraea sp. NBC_01738]
MRTENPKHATQGEYTGGRFRLANWRVRSRLVALILIPTIVGVLLAGIQLADAIGTSAEYRRLTQVAEMVQRIGALSHEVGKERALTAWYVADHRRSGRMAQLREQRELVNTAKTSVLDATAAIDASHSPRVRQEVETMRRWLNGLDGLRASITGPTVPARASIRTYSSLIQVLENVQDELTQAGDDELFGEVAALGALQRAKEEVSRQQVILLVALVERKLDYDDLSDFLGAWNAQQAELSTFDQEAGAKFAKLYNDTVRGQAIDRADAMRQRALAQMREYKEIRDLDTTVTPRRELMYWFDSTTSAVSSMRKVEDSIATSVVTRTRDLSDAERNAAVISGAIILVLLLLVLVITTRVAGSLVRPLRRLRAEALQVATTRLPETVRVLRESGDGAEVPEVPSVGVNTRDEIGEVARAFDEVHREAIRLAGDEAKLRANVNSMFVNLSRRSQTLVERQLQLIEGLEQGEEDENRLANLFRLDHLATRMRRNSENLLVLAGQEAARKWSDPVPLVDIARASLSEVENYERVQIQIPSDIQVVGPAVTDAVHLLAELIENAISFSPRESKVAVTSSSVEGGILVSISDLGIGMSADELAEANWRLANPPVVDVSVSRRMGLFVVGRLALRHGVRVQLRMRETGGLSALVMLPDQLIAGQAGMVPQPRGQYESFTTFDPAMLGAPLGAPDTPDVRTEAPVDTQWPGTIPAPDTGWPSFAEGPSASWPSFAEQPPPLAEPPAVEPSAADRRIEDRWPSFAEQPPRRLDEDDWAANAFASGAFASDPFTPDPASSNGNGNGNGNGHGPKHGGQDTGAGFGEERRWPSFGDEGAWPSVGSQPPAPATRPGDTGNFAPWNTDYTSQDMTGPLPVVRNSPIEDEPNEEFLPIFSSVGSDWFRRPEPDQLKPRHEEARHEEPRHQEAWHQEEQPYATPAASFPPAQPPQAPSPYGAQPQHPAPGGQAPGKPALPQRRPGESGAGASWSSPADAGFQAAQAAAEPALGGTTSSGLPRRVPKANLVPGTASLAEPQATSPAPPISPERLRSRLSSFQQGVRQGREDLKEKE